MKLAKSAIRMNGTRMASGSTGNSRAHLIERPPTLANSRGATATAAAFVCSVMSAMAHLLGEANAWIDIRVENVDDQIDHHDHNPGLHDDALHEREVALEDALVEQPADPGPGKDHLDDHRRVDHDDEVDPGQCQHRDQRVLEGVDRNYRIAGQALQTRELDVLAAQHLEHAR